LKLSKLLQHEHSFNIINAQRGCSDLLTMLYKWQNLVWSTKYLHPCAHVSCYKNLHILIWWALQRNKKHPSTSHNDQFFMLLINMPVRGEQLLNW